MNHNAKLVLICLHGLQKGYADQITKESELPSPSVRGALQALWNRRLVNRSTDRYGTLYSINELGEEVYQKLEKEAFEKQ
tara:strand:- start:619 stop:858 length:240 start_codon:yes stop_codon:yes gene_type:complete